MLKMSLGSRLLKSWLSAVINSNGFWTTDFGIKNVDISVPLS